MKKLTTYVTIFAAVAMVILPCIQNVIANILFNKKRNFIIEHNGKSVGLLCFHL